MFSQLEEEISYVGGEGFRAILMKDSDGGAGVDNGIPKVDFGGREVKYWGYAKGN